MSYSTYRKIKTLTTSTSQASLDLTDIPQNYDDLVVKWSVQSTNSTRDQAFIKFNGTSANYIGQELRAYDGSNRNSTTSATTSFDMNRIGGGTNFTDVFTNGEFYIPSYSGSSNKSVSFDFVLSTNATSGLREYLSLSAGLWSNTAAINQITFTLSAGNFAANSTVTIYGIKRGTA